MYLSYIKIFYKHKITQYTFLLIKTCVTRGFFQSIYCNGEYKVRHVIVLINIYIHTYIIHIQISKYLI